MFLPRQVNLLLPLDQSLSWAEDQPIGVLLMELVGEMCAKTCIQVLGVLEHFTDQHSIQADPLLPTSVDDRAVGVTSFEEQMLVELVDEVTLDRFEGLVHAVEDEVVPVGREAHKLAEARWIVLDQSEGDRAIEWVLSISESDSAAPRLRTIVRHLVLLSAPGTVLLHLHQVIRRTKINRLLLVKLTCGHLDL